MIKRTRRESGFTMIEVMMAMFILAVGLLACTSMVVMGMAGNTRNQNDSGATLVSQMVMEQLNSISANAVVGTPATPVAINLTDCAGNPWTIKTIAGAQPTGAGAKPLQDQNGNFYAIDFTQAANAVPAGYQMNYIMCASQVSRQATYDVRWNIMALTADTNLITVSSRQTSTANGSAVIFANPVTLRTIQGP